MSRGTETIADDLISGVFDEEFAAETNAEFRDLDQLEQHTERATEELQKRSLQSQTGTSAETVAQDQDNKQYEPASSQDSSMMIATASAFADADFPGPFDEVMNGLAQQVPQRSDQSTSVSSEPQELRPTPNASPSADVRQVLEWLQHPQIRQEIFAIVAQEAMRGQSPLGRALGLGPQQHVD